jgi:hypothetical protein
LIYGCPASALTYPSDDPGKFLVVVEDKTTGTIGKLHPLRIHQIFGQFLGPDDFVKKTGESKLTFQLSSAEKANSFVKLVNGSSSTYPCTAFIPARCHCHWCHT